MIADVAGACLNSSAANFSTAVNGVFSGTLSTLNGSFGSEVNTILNVTLFAAGVAIFELPCKTLGKMRDVEIIMRSYFVTTCQIIVQAATRHPPTCMVYFRCFVVFPELNCASPRYKANDLSNVKNIRSTKVILFFSNEYYFMSILTVRTLILIAWYTKSY